MKTINFAVVGAGMIGKRHIAMIDENKYANLCCVCDIRPRIDTKVREDVDYYNTINTMLTAHSEIDVVCICTPNALHAQMAIEVLKSGHNVVVEKPLAINTDDAKKVAEAERKSGKIAFMVMQNRYSPPSQWIKQVIDSKLLGDIRTVNINCMWNRDERYYTPGHWHGTAEYDGGTLFTQFSHFIDIMLWLVGEVKSIDAARFNDFAHAQLTDFEDSGMVLFTLQNGAMANLSYTTAVPNSNLESSITIVGSKGAVKIAGQYMNEVVYCNIENYTMPKLAECNKPNDYGPYKGSAANHCYIIQNVVETLNGQSEPTTRVAEGIAVVDFIERVYKLRDKSYLSTTKLQYKI